MVRIWNFIWILIMFWARGGLGDDCMRRKFNHNSFVCVCNSTYCDSSPPAEAIPMGTYLLYKSSQDEYRLYSTQGFFMNTSQNTKKGIEFVVDKSIKFQPIHGFGGSFTDNAGMNILLLSQNAQGNLLRSYFSSNGIKYNLCRVPMGGTDYSPRKYTYDDHENDVSLSQFSLQKEDYELKMPLMNRSQAMSGGNVRFISAAWRAPSWMRDKNIISNFKYLRKEFYQTWADYHVKFLEAYKKAGVDFWGISTGNEPFVAVVFHFTDAAMAWVLPNQIQWIEKNLGPTIRNSSFNHVFIMGIDDSRSIIPLWMDTVALNPNALRYIDGIAVHTYDDSHIPSTVLDQAHTKHPDKFILYTETSIGQVSSFFGINPMRLGSWKDAETYATSIIQNLQHWVTGYIDWNLAVDMKGGPNLMHINNDAPIIVNPEEDEFYKQPIFYIIGHFSKFVDSGAYRISVTPEKARGVFSLGFVNPDGRTVIIILNTRSTDVNIFITDPGRGTIPLLMRRKTIFTLIYP